MMLVAQRRTKLRPNRSIASTMISGRRAPGTLSGRSATIASSTTDWISFVIVSVRPVIRNAQLTPSTTKRVCSRHRTDRRRTVGQNGRSGGSTGRLSWVGHGASDEGARCRRSGGRWGAQGRGGCR